MSEKGVEGRSAEEESGASTQPNAAYRSVAFLAKPPTYLTPSNAHVTMPAVPAVRLNDPVPAEQLRRVPGASHARRIGRHPERVEHEPDHRRVGDLAKHA